MVKNRKKNCHQKDIIFNLKGNGNLFPWVWCQLQDIGAPKYCLLKLWSIGVNLARKSTNGTRLQKPRRSYLAVRECISVSWGPNSEPPNTPRTLQHYQIEGFKGCPELGPHYAEGRQSLGQQIWGFPVSQWNVSNKWSSTFLNET